MSKSNRQRRAAKQRRVKRDVRTTRRDRDEPELHDIVRAALADPDPLSLLSLVSTLLTSIDPRANRDPFGGPAPVAGMPTREEFAAMFIDVVVPETTAMLAVIGAFSGDDDLLRVRIRRELDTRPPIGVPWLGKLDETVAYRAVRMGHILGDGDNVMLGVRLAGGHELTLIGYIDHNLGGLIKDAFVVSEPIADMVAEYRRIADEPDMIWEELSLADARVWLDEAIAMAAITFPPIETEQWPACRPLFEWITRDLPDGGVGCQRPEWDSAALSALSDRFFSSAWGSKLDDADHRDLLESLLWYATDYGPGDPLRWSAVQVEILFGDWLPRKVIAPAEYLAKAPELLRAFVSFVHAESGVRDELTAQTLAAIDECAPRYQQTIRSPRPQGPAALLEALGLNSDDDPVSNEEWFLNHYAREVGGVEQLDRLGTAPLPDEPFAWSGIAEDITERVAEVLELTDRCCDELLDVEYRTAARRVLARVASGDPAVFRRKSKVETAAAAVLWIVGKANGLFESYPGQDWGPSIQVGELTTYFGLGKTSVSQRAATMLRAGGFPDDTYVVRLGSPDYLIAVRRRWLIERRDRIRGIADD